VRASLPFRTVPLPVPLPLVRGVLALARAAGSTRLSPALVDRLGHDLVADDRAARVDFGYAPRPFRPDSACWDTTVPFSGD